MTYGLQAKAPADKQYGELEHFASNCNSEIAEPQWLLKLTNKHIIYQQVYQKNTTTKH